MKKLVIRKLSCKDNKKGHCAANSLQVYGPDKKKFLILWNE